MNGCVSLEEEGPVLPAPLQVGPLPVRMGQRALHSRGSVLQPVVGVAQTASFFHAFLPHELQHFLQVADLPRSGSTVLLRNSFLSASPSLAAAISWMRWMSLSLCSWGERLRAGGWATTSLADWAAIII